VTPAEPAIPWVAVGRATRAHGIHGEVSVLSLTDVPERFQAGSRVFVGEDGTRPLTVAGSRPHRDRVLVRFEEVPDRTAAEALAGAYLFVPADSSPPLPEDEFWPHQILGAEVRLDSGRSLGRVAEIVRTQANDVWVTRGEDSESLIPALRDVVLSVDVPGGVIVVREIPGLTVPETAEGGTEQGDGR
jgi:16S rRNA processing protein RimM